MNTNYMRSPYSVKIVRIPIILNECFSFYVASAIKWIIIATYFSQLMSLTFLSFFLFNINITIWYIYLIYLYFSVLNAMRHSPPVKHYLMFFVSNHCIEFNAVFSVSLINNVISFSIDYLSIYYI